MILADKLIELRKRDGLSQEQLAEVMGVSRQAISKWESAQSTPDMNKILKLAHLFDVSTDYLLKDELDSDPAAPVPSAEPAVDDSGKQLTPVSMEEASAFLGFKEQSAGRIAFGVMLCILSPILLILLSGANETGRLSIGENRAVMLGVIILLLMVGGAVAIFVSTGLRGSRYDYLSKDSLDTAYGVAGMVSEHRSIYNSDHIRNMVIGVTLCVLSCLPLLFCVVLDEENEFLTLIGVAILLLLVAIGVFLIVKTSIIWGSFNALLEEGDYTRANKKKDQTIGRIYWCVVTAAYLGISFLTMRWEITWAIWPVAGVLYGIFG